MRTLIMPSILSWHTLVIYQEISVDDIFCRISVIYILKWCNLQTLMILIQM